MVQAVLHIIIPLIVFDLIRHYYFNRKFPRYIILIGGIAGILPDIDVPLSWLLSFVAGKNISIHGQFTHTLFYTLHWLILFLFFYFKNDRKLFTKSNHKPLVFLVITLGGIIHLSLDCISGGYYFFWPFSNANYCPSFISESIAPGLDAILLILWLIHEETHHLIRDYF